MKNVTVHTGTLTVIKRLPSSANGNPRYLLSLDGWTCRTSPDSSLAYDIPRLNGKRVSGHIGTLRGNATISNVIEL